MKVLFPYSFHAVSGMKRCHLYLFIQLYEMAFKILYTSLYMECEVMVMNVRQNSMHFSYRVASKVTLVIMNVNFYRRKSYVTVFTPFHESCEPHFCFFQARPLFPKLLIFRFYNC